jgi:hypothetical protein
VGAEHRVDLVDKQIAHILGGTEWAGTRFHHLKSMDCLFLEFSINIFGSELIAIAQSETTDKGKTSVLRKNSYFFFIVWYTCININYSTSLIYKIYCFK